MRILNGLLRPKTLHKNHAKHIRSTGRPLLLKLATRPSFIFEGGQGQKDCELAPKGAQLPQCLGTKPVLLWTDSNPRCGHGTREHLFCLTMSPT